MLKGYVSLLPLYYTKKRGRLLGLKFCHTPVTVRHNYSHNWLESFYCMKYY